MEPDRRVPLSEILRVFLRVGTIGFGGFAGILVLIRQAVVEKRRWLNEEQLAVAVAMGQMLPGPFVSNYAEYIGYELRGMPGMIAAAVSLLAPCFLLMCALSFLYFRFGSVPVVSRLFAGVQPVVVGILAWATLSVGRANIRHWFGLPIAAAAATALYFGVDVLLVTVGCGVLGIAFSGAWRWRKPEAHTQAADSATRSPESKVKGLLLSVGPLLGSAAGMAGPALSVRAAELAFVFLKVGTVIFGGGFAAIPFLQHEVVDLRHWLTMREFIDGVALGQMTPGPVAITATFIGYKVLGLPGALLATLGTFVPSFFMLWGLIHIYRRVSGHWLVRGFLAGVLPAVVGMILSATVFIGRAALTGPAPALAALLAMLLLLRFRTDPVWLILGGALLGLVPGWA
jgi:chromate transporter